MGCVVFALFDLVLPSGKIKKCAAVALFAAFALTVVYPLVKNTFDDFEFSFDLDGEASDETTETFLNEFIESAYSKDITSSLLSVDLVAERVEVEYCRGEILKIEVYLSNAVFIDDDGHIDNNVIADYVSKELGLDRDKLVVYV